MEYIVEEEKLLLEFLLESIPRVSKSKVKSLLKYGQVTVDGKTVTAFDYILRRGYIVKISKDTKESARTRGFLDIICEDDEIIVINKPDGLLSVSAGRSGETTAYSLVSAYSKAVNSKNRIFIVHRLDRDTSGLLLFAKNEKIRNLLQEDWNRIVTARKYYAIVEGAIEAKHGVITSWLREDKNHVIHSGKAAGGGKPAITEYAVIKETGSYSLLDISIKTGRKNQIRVHLRDIGHPVIGDKKYHSKVNPIQRLGLHAYKLELIHPVTKETMTFQNELPQKFKALLAKS